MSHTTRVAAVKIMSINALKAAILQLNAKKGVKIELLENTGARVWARSINCPYVVRVPGCRFDIGLEASKDGKGFTLVYDYHGNEIYKHLGQGAQQAKTSEEQHLSHVGQLMQAYGVHAMQEAASQNMGMCETYMNEKTGEAVIMVY